jgi:hypothetical protein
MSASLSIVYRSQLTGKKKKEGGEEGGTGRGRGEIDVFDAES